MAEINNVPYDGNNPEELRRQVFQPVAARMRARGDTLKHVTRFLATGIEGWFKVEVIAALGQQVERLRNKGADLGLCGDCSVELKASTNLTWAWVVAGLKYRTPCLFLGNMSATAVEKLKTDPRMALVAHEIFSDGAQDWIIGLVVPSKLQESIGAASAST